MILALILGVGEPELYAVGAAAVTAVASWIVYAMKIKGRCAEFSAALARQQAEAEAALTSVEKTAADQQADAKKILRETSIKLAEVEQRFSTHRDVADRRQTDASIQITRLEADLASSRQVAAQLVPTQERIKDLERALLAEQGRVQAQEQTIQATNARAADFEKRLADTQDLVMKHKGEMQEVAVELKKVRDEQAAYLAAGGIEAELAKAREAAQQSEAKNANLQRALKVAETRVEMVQKEFMNAVGLATAPVGGAAPSSATTGDKKVRELEEKVTQMEAEARKRAREDGYKIAELEYRLSEALETARAAASAPAPPTSPAITQEAERESGTDSFPQPAPEHSSSVEAVAAAPVPDPSPVPSMPAALAPAVVEIPPMDSAEESVPAQPAAAPPEVAVGPTETTLTSEAAEPAPPENAIVPDAQTQTEADETAGGVGADDLLKAPESPASATSFDPPSLPAKAPPAAPAVSTEKAASDAE